MSLLDGLNGQLRNPLYDYMVDAQIDDRLDFEGALESATDSTLSPDDIEAILNDNDPDSQIADMSLGEDGYPEGAFESSLRELMEGSLNENDEAAMESLVAESERLLAAMEADSDDLGQSDELGQEDEIFAANESDDPPTDSDENSDREASASESITDILEQLQMA